MKKEECRFCQMVDNNQNLSYDQPLLINEKYFAVPSIGALVDGWTLIISREHKCSMKDMYCDKLLPEIINQTLSRLRSFYSGKFIIFEHAPNRENSLTSCGTNHAHLHIVPYDNSLIENSEFEWKTCYTSDISGVAQDDEYLFYYELQNNEVWENPLGKLHLLEAPISQYFRRIIAEQLGCSAMFDYKIYPNINHVLNTQYILSGVPASPAKA